MNISETCIRRPVLTTLMTASLIVFGAFAYRLLPVAALPAVDFPTIQITAQLPGASPETMASSVASPIERQLSTIAGISSMNSSSSLGHHADHRPVRPRPQHRRRGARRADRAFGGGEKPAGRNDHAAELPQGQSGRLPGALRQHALRHHAVVGGRRLRRNGAGAEHFADARHRPGAGLWRAEIRRPRAGRSGGRGRAQHFARRRPQCRRRDQFQRAGRHVAGRAADGDAARHRRHAPRVRLPQRGGGLSQRRAGQAQPDRQRDRQRRERQDRDLVQRRARHRAGDPAPARRQHRRGGGRGAQCIAGDARAGSGGDPDGSRCSTARSRSAPRSSTCRRRWRSPSRW